MANLKEKIKYHTENDYLLPNIAIQNSNFNNYQIGKYGYLRLEYLKMYKKCYYTDNARRNITNAYCRY